MRHGETKKFVGRLSKGIYVCAPSMLMRIDRYLHLPGGGNAEAMDILYNVYGAGISLGVASVTETASSLFRRRKRDVANETGYSAIVEPQDIDDVI